MARLGGRWRMVTTNRPLDGFGAAVPKVTAVIKI